MISLSPTLFYHSVASLANAVLDPIMEFCYGKGLLAILHNDIDMPFPKSGQDNWDLDQYSALMKCHPIDPSFGRIAAW